MKTNISYFYINHDCGSRQLSVNKTLGKENLIKKFGIDQDTAKKLALIDVS